ncbi:unnamed protein product [Urochloa decumbens]|uniref:Receptor-like serine/threonine-protein kinase n=2 Tax=Urochloa decumbens TaxID=240449 RepID=A0ABC9BXG8_9POAL
MASKMSMVPMHFTPICATLLFLSCSFSSMHLCASSDHLVPGKPLTPGNTLVSDDGTFALGFFSLSNSTEKHYYVGIWYNNIPQRAFVWVANRVMPITNLSFAMLAVTSSSNIVLSEEGRILWRSNSSRSISSSPATTISAEGTLENTGNFILRPLGNSTILWQSFDHPADTLLPGMNLRISHKMHPLQHLISWKGPRDPSPGPFSYGADPDSFLQRFIWNNTMPHRRSPVWTSYFLLGSYTDNLHPTIYMAVHRGDDDEVYMSFGIPIDSLSLLIRMEISYSGKVNILSWNSNMSAWTALYTQPAHRCNGYAYCGPYGYCDNSGTAPTCKCIDGFEPKDDEDWINGRFLEGCHRKKALRCSGKDGFLTLPGMKIPDHFLLIRNKSFDECTVECLSNCSCVAYAYANMSTRAIDGDDTRCLIWTGMLIDTEKCSERGENLYIRTNKLSGSMRATNILEIVLPVLAALLAFICTVFIWICWFRGKQGSKKILTMLMLGDMDSNHELADRKLDLPLISFREISIATHNFSDSGILGGGGFGTVYKGTLGDQEIAVKRLCSGSGQGLVEFKNEVVLIAKLQHRNLVKLLGCCIDGDERLLIYEYLSNKSLDAFLFNAARKSLLDWPTRFQIIKGVARGLLYLHQDSRLKIIHRDLKASNVLLDAEMRPKISDFGTARIFGIDEQQSNTNRVVGTYGYMSPEYALEGIVSLKSDVYSFGVLLLEVVSGLKISATSPITGSPNLIAYAWGLWKDGNLRDLVDPSIVESCSPDEILRCIHIGLLLVQDNPNARPLMPWVVSSLDNNGIELPQPSEPSYFARRSYRIVEAGESSVSNMSLGTLEGR